MVKPERLVGAVIVACLGWGTWAAAIAWLPEADEEHWTAGAPMAALQVAALAGEFHLDPQALDLWGYRSAIPRLPPTDEGSVRIRARVPDDGELHVMVGATPDQVGPRGPVRRDQRDGAAVFGPVVVVDRTRGTITGSRGLSCTPMAAPSEQRFELELQLSETTARVGDADQVIPVVEVSLDGEVRGSCRGALRPGQFVFASGLRRIQVEEVHIQSPEGVLHDDFHSFVRGPLGWICTAMGALIGFFARRPVLASVPWLAIPWLATLPTRSWLDSLRLMQVPEGAAPFLLAGLPGLALVLLAAARGRRLQVSLALGLAAGGLCVVAGSPLLLAAIALPWAGLAHVNRNPVRYRGLWSYGLLGLALVLAEFGIRTSSVNATWQRTEGWDRATMEFRELLELKHHRTYPRDGFPVRPPPPTTTPRIVALGGSSTGGAFQMDDLDLFWPARLQEILSGWEVVNQGVGGWNTLHIRLYVEGQWERLDPDILLLYIGHNDIMTTAPVPYSSLYAHYTPGSEPSRQNPLEKSRLYFGLRFAVLALRDSKPGRAVPLSDAEDNLRAILELAGEIPVVLMTEGVNPDPFPMRPYAALQERLAAEYGQHHLDTATALDDLQSTELFIDDCHLTERGHRVLAGIVATELRASELVEDRPQTPGESPPPRSP